VANLDSNSVSVIDTTTNNVIKTVDVGSWPYGVEVNSEGTKVYVANDHDNTVSVIDTTTNTVTAIIPVGNHPKAFGKFIGSNIDKKENIDSNQENSIPQEQKNQSSSKLEQEMPSNKAKSSSSNRNSATYDNRISSNNSLINVNINLFTEKSSDDNGNDILSVKSIVYSISIFLVGAIFRAILNHYFE
jgi:YVTN family beta-propeller protein